MRDELEKKIAELDLTGAVTLPGFLEQGALRELFTAAHVFVHPSEMTPDSNQEGIPNSMLEAMATGLPVVATHHGGIPEAVRENQDGFLVMERDKVALADALCRAVEHPARWIEMGRAASERVRDEFELCRQISKLEEYYDEARDKARAAGF